MFKLPKFPKRKFKITKAGYSFIFLCLGIGGAALNTGNNLLYLLFGMMTSFIIVSGILSDSSMRRLELVREVPGEISANARFPVRITVKNKKSLIPSYSLSVLDMVDQIGDNTRFIVKVPPLEEKEIFYFSSFPDRGLKRYRGFKVLTKYPFGLIQKTDFIEHAEEVLVYPQIFDIERIMVGSHLFHGEYLSGRKGLGVNPWGLRNYQYGDDARLIHWKSTAKKGDWMVKEFESEKKLKVVLDLVLVHPDALSAKAFKRREAKTLIEKLISMCASVMAYLVKNNYEVDLTINGVQIENSGRRYISNYMKELALIDVERLPRSIMKDGAANGERIHVVITNLSKGRPLNLGNAGMVIDGNNVDSFYRREDEKGGEA